MHGLPICIHFGGLKGNVPIADRAQREPGFRRNNLGDTVRGLPTETTRTAPHGSSPNSNAAPSRGYYEVVAGFTLKRLTGGEVTNMRQETPSCRGCLASRTHPGFGNQRKNLALNLLITAKPLQPCDFRLATKPRHLPLGVVPMCLLRCLHRQVARDFPA